MNKEELQDLLEETYELPFLWKIERLFEEEKEYKKSDFFKKYKIPLVVLYEKFEAYQRSNKNLKEELDVWIEEIIDKLTDFIKKADTDLIVSKIGDFLESANASEKVTDFINNLLDNFDVKQLEKLAQDFEEGIKNLK